MKKFGYVLLALLAIGLCALFIWTGFNTRSDVYMQEFSVSDDGEILKFRTMLSGSMGYIRAVDAETIDDAIYCKFYSAFGGLNSGIGSRSRFEIDLSDSVNKIYFDRGSQGYDLVLEKDIVTNTWSRVY